MRRALRRERVCTAQIAALLTLIAFFDVCKRVALTHGKLLSAASRVVTCSKTVGKHLQAESHCVPSQSRSVAGVLGCCNSARVKGHGSRKKLFLSCCCDLQLLFCLRFQRWIVKPGWKAQTSEVHAAAGLSLQASSRGSFPMLTITCHFPRGQQDKALEDMLAATQAHRQIWLKHVMPVGICMLSLFRWKQAHSQRSKHHSSRHPQSRQTKKNRRTRALAAARW